MKTELKMVMVKITEKVIAKNNEGIDEEQIFETTKAIPVQELNGLIFQLDIAQIETLEILGTTTQEFYTEDEVEELNNENEELRNKLDNAWNYIDNIGEHLNDMRYELNTALEDLEYATDDSQRAREECDHE